jgi:hypothetical protein
VGAFVAIWTDKKYINLLSFKLERFAWKGDFLANCRCPVCGDSVRDKRKARGYLYRRKNDMKFKCHNCGLGLSIGRFIKLIDASLYREYVLEKYKDGVGAVKPAVEKQIAVPNSAVRRFAQKIELPSIASLPKAHYARAYIEGRKIPDERLTSLYFADDFAAFVKSLLPDNEHKLGDNDPRIVIPFFDKQNTLIAFQGRSLKADKFDPLRYITIKTIEDAPKVFGLDRFNRDHKSYVLEGPFDSMFIPNALAAAGSSLRDLLRLVDKDNATFVFDNEPRNRDIVRQIDQCITAGLRVCIWPSQIKQKDINLLITHGLTPLEIRRIIDRSSFKGIEASLKFSSWKKI